MKDIYKAMIVQLMEFARHFADANPSDVTNIY